MDDFLVVDVAVVVPLVPTLLPEDLQGPGYVLVREALRPVPRVQDRQHVGR